MNTAVEIDEELVAAAMELTGLKSKQEAVEKALTELVQVRRAQRTMMELRGKVEWEGDLDAMRRGN